MIRALSTDISAAPQVSARSPILALPAAAQAADYRGQLSEAISSGTRRRAAHPLR